MSAPRSGLRKCLIWDLDETLWDGTCLEGDVRVRSDARDTLRELDDRGILHSIASRGVEDVSRDVLQSNRLDDYFLVPRINWLPKPTNISAIARDLDIALDAVAFIDDDAFEREQVRFMLPEVLVLDAADVASLVGMEDFRPPTSTTESGSRREYYRAEQGRRRLSEQFPDRVSFLKACEMHLTVRAPGPEDGSRILELMSRTHQLNTTGLLLSREDVRALLAGEIDGQTIVIADLTDRFGPYGTIGVALAVDDRPVRRLDFLALSCRVLGRGIERAFLRAVMDDGQRHGLTRLEARYRPTGRNLAMRTLFQMAGFSSRAATGDGDEMNFACPFDDAPASPAWVATS